MEVDVLCVEVLHGVACCQLLLSSPGSCVAACLLCYALKCESVFLKCDHFVEQPADCGTVHFVALCFDAVLYVLMCDVDLLERACNP